MFSQLIAGPIVRYAQIADELKGRRHTLALFGLGARRFMVGFCMKVIIADTLSPLVDAIFKLPNPTLADSWLGAIGYTLQLYFDFAGYSAMAIGLALMIGFHFPENFNFPYLAGSIQAFWNRWHITLSSFLRDYLYIPFGGNRLGSGRTYVNLMLTMLIGGLWHGANWTFVVWAAGRAGCWRCIACTGPKGSTGNAVDHRPSADAGGRGARLGGVPRRHVRGGAEGSIAHARPERHRHVGRPGLAATPDRVWMAADRRCRGLRAADLPPGCRGDRPGGAGAVPVGPFCGFLLAMVLLYSRAAVPFLYFQF